MSRVKVNAWHKALVFKDNRYLRMLAEGKHWLKNGETVVHYDMSKPFVTTHNLDILLQDEALAAELEIMTVPQGELLIRYERNLFQAVLGPGRYVHWKGIFNYTHQVVDLSKIWVTEDIARAVLAEPAVMHFLRQYTVESFERALLYVEGQFEKELDPGVYFFWKNPVTVTVYKQDIRQLQMDINGQEILTKDKANLRINCTLQYRVTDLFKAVANKEFERQLYVLMQFALREHVTAYTLDELLEKRDTITPAILAAVAEKAAELGVQLTGCGIRDVILPGDVKEIMNQVLLAEKKAQANIIMRREETASTRSLLNTAKLMEENEMLFKLKEMEYVEKISDKISHLSVSGGGDLVAQLRQLFMPGSR